MYGFHDFQTATKLAEQKTNETGQQHCVLHAEDVDGPGGMFTLGVYLPQHEEISGVELIKKVMGTLRRMLDRFAARERAELPNRQ